MIFRSDGLTARLLAAFVLAFGWSNAADAEGGFGDSLLVLISGGMRGRAEGCGCSGGSLGGLDRRATVVRELVGAAPYVGVDCGAILDLDPEGGRTRSHCSIAGLARQGLKVIGATSRDLFYGPNFLRDAAHHAGVTVVSANLTVFARPATRLFDEWAHFELQGAQIAVTSLCAPAPARTGGQPESWTAVTPDSLLPSLQASIPPHAACVVLLTDLDEAALRRLLNQSDLFDVAVTSSRQTFTATPFRVGRCVVIHPEADGRSVDALVIPRSGRAAEGRHIRLPVTLRAPADAATADWLKECLGKGQTSKLSH